MKVRIEGIGALEATGYTAIVEQWARLELGATETISVAAEGDMADLVVQADAGDRWSVAYGQAVAARLTPSAVLGLPTWYAGMLLPSVTRVGTAPSGVPGVAAPVEAEATLSADIVAAAAPVEAVASEATPSAAVDTNIVEEDAAHAEV